MKSQWSVSTLLCLGLLCLASTVTIVKAVPCAPVATDELPKCNGTVFATYTSQNCQGNVTYNDGSSSTSVQSGNCVESTGFYTQAGAMRSASECTFGQPIGSNEYFKTPSDPYGNCTQDFTIFFQQGTSGACLNNRATNTSSAFLCDASQVPYLPPSTDVAPGPVVLNAIGGSNCYAPDRCQSIFYSTSYEGLSCGRSMESAELVEAGIQLDTCYDYRASPDSPSSISNVMYTFDGTFFSVKMFLGGCSGTVLYGYTIRANTCHRSGPNSSTMFKVNIDPSTSPITQSQGPTGASSSMHDRIQMSVFVSLMLCFIAMLLSVTA